MTSNMTPTSLPEARVLLTTELAEQILSYLPFEDLIHAEQVCRKWRDIIPWSSHTRQGLFLEPTLHFSRIPYRSVTKLRNPRQYYSLNIMPYIETYKVALLHPYLLHTPEMERRGLTAFTLDWEKALSLRPEGRWRDMFIAQPPCRNVRIECQVVLPGPEGTGTEDVYFSPRDRVSNVSGVRLGSMVDKLRDVLAQASLDCLLKSSHEGLRLGDLKPRFVRVDCFIDGFISEQAAFVLASQAPVRKTLRVNLE